MQLWHAVRSWTVVRYNDNAVFIEFTSFVCRFYFMLTLENHSRCFDNALFFFYCRDFHDRFT